MALMPAVASLQSLRHLALSDSGVQVYQSMAYTSQLQHLTALDLSGNGALRTISESQKCAEGLRAMRALRWLRLGHLHMDEIESVAIASALTALTSLTSLSLENNQLRRSGTAALAQALPALSELVSLALDETVLVPTGPAAALGSALRALPRLQRLTLYNARLSDYDIATLLNSQPSDSSGSCDAAESAPDQSAPAPPTPAAQLHASSGAFRALVRLDIGCAKPAGEHHSVPFAAGLQRITTLESLELDSCNLCDRGAAALAPVVAALTRLTLLRLGDNRLTRDGVASLAGVLAGLPGLQAVHFDNNYLGPEDVAKLAPRLRGLAAW